MTKQFRAAQDRMIITALGAVWGEAVATVRHDAELSQAAVAERCGITQQTVSKIERGLMVPLDLLKLRLAAALEVDPGQLFAWPEFMPDELRPPPRPSKAIRAASRPRHPRREST